jgi:nitric oxide reductase activation protein
VFTQIIRAIFPVVALTVAMALPAWAQRQSAPPVAPSTDRNTLGTAPSDEDEASARLAHDMAKKANLERQAAIKTDAEKLLKLAVELKASVDKSNENLLSMDVVKKAEEIERLAHSVKDKMKGPN